MNCPKCGAKVAAVRPSITIFACGSECDKYPPAFYETPQCLRNQLATVTAERDTARAELKRLSVEWDVLWAKVNTHFDPKGVTVVFQLVIDWMREIRTQGVLRLSGEQPATAEKGAEE